MNIGDLVKVKEEHWGYMSGEFGIILEDKFPSKFNRGKAFLVLFSNGKTKTKLSKHLEVVSEN